MIVAITGGGGFIGQYLVSWHISRGHKVRVLTRNSGTKLDNEIEIHQGDLTQDNQKLIDFVDGADILYHCAAELRDEIKMHEVNVRGTERLIAAASGRVGRWVQLSSVGAYGPVQRGVITECTSERPVGLYEETKTQADNLVRKAASDGAFETVIVRPSNVYGEEMPNQSLFQLFSMVDRGWFFFLGPKGASANYIHVQDVVEGLALCATHPAATGQTFNLSNWDTMESLVESVACVLGRPATRLRLPLAPVRLLASTVGAFPKIPLTRARVDALSSQSWYATDKIEQELGFFTKVPVSEGMAALARWWKTF